MKSATEWIESVGIPLDKGGAIRFVAQIQEDAVRCYETTATIEEVELAFEQLRPMIEDNDDLAHMGELLGAFNVLKLKLQDLAKLKVPSE